MKLSKNFLPILELPISLFRSVSKAEIQSSGPCNIGSRLGNAIFGWRIQNHFFWGNRTNLETLQKFSPYIGVSYNFVLKCVKGRNRIFWVIEYWYKALEWQIWSTNRKLFFFGKARQSFKFSKNVLSILEFPTNCSEVCQRPKSNLLSDWTLVKGFRMWNLVDEYETIFLGKWDKLGTLQKVSAYIGVSYKCFRKPPKGQNRIFWVIEYWNKALECQIWLSNTRPFFWEREAKLRTLQKLSFFIGVSYKFVFKPVKGLNRILWAMKYWLKVWEYQIWLRYTKSFFWESKTKLGTL